MLTSSFLRAVKAVPWGLPVWANRRDTVSYQRKLSLSHALSSLLHNWVLHLFCPMPCPSLCLHHCQTKLCSSLAPQNQPCPVVSPQRTTPRSPQGSFGRSIAFWELFFSHIEGRNKREKNIFKTLLAQGLEKEKTLQKFLQEHNTHTKNYLRFSYLSTLRLCFPFRDFLYAL